MLASRNIVYIYLCGLFCGVLFSVVYNGRLHVVQWCEPRQVTVDLRPEQNHTITQRTKNNDEELSLHNDDASVAIQLANKIRVLCVVMTTQTSLWTKAIYIKNTWGQRCNKLVFMSDVDDTTFPAIGLQTKPGRWNLPLKTKLAFKYIYNHHIDDADWFLKVEDDSYVILENLRYMLSVHDTNKPIFFGHHFKASRNLHYFSGGGGYVLSKEALKRYANGTTILCQRDRGAEDQEFGKCMHSLNVKFGPSKDKLGRSRFHCFSAQYMLQKEFPSWYHTYDQDNTTKNSPSDYPISFFNNVKKKMYEMEYFTYHLSVYGIKRGLQELN